ncbi:BNR/Asp-box repeat domain protein [Coleofasciculus chthonoplastes PCC 7420]|uniref:BNR/Asp-box repeat domain protein n=1 Tax=Coleofasciculus chthonoplastes PCC 7420 TaxID=118168 RepID=B4VT44_9CYAN|nr:YCF48-related protein [Coleofasciculus chthonoplastes]EDX74816.1 BNR/Asp-box repeat domain protein [Coleofasciculus chthonoplastes PCC 7420]
MFINKWLKSTHSTQQKVGLLHKKVFINFFLVLALFCLTAQPALAHRPHDVVTQVDLSPGYEQNQVLFIIVRGNLFKSTDGGSSWQRIVNGLDNRSSLAALSISPTNSVLFVSSFGDGIYKSSDGGNSWQNVSNGLENLNIEVLEIAPNAPDFVLAAGSEGGLYKTDDGGVTWNQVLDNPSKIKTISFIPDNPSSIVIGDEEGTIYVSRDRGETWQAASPIETPIENSGAITTLVVSPNFSSDQTIFVGTDKGGVLQTTDFGGSFTPLNQGLSDPSIQDIVISPSYVNDNTLFASTWNDGFFYSQDGGKTWKKSSQGLVKESQADQMKSPHFTDLSISENTLFLGGFDGLFKSTDNGQSWQLLETLLPETIVALAVSPDYENDSTVAIAPYVGDPYISNDAGINWTQRYQGLESPYLTRSFDEQDQDPRRFFDIAFSPNYGSDQTVFATLLWENFLRSTNGGKSWQRTQLPKVPKYSTRGMTIATSPAFDSDQTIYLLTQQGVIYKSTNAGKSFSVLSKIGKDFSNETASIVISPDFPSDPILYASSSDPGVFQSSDAGKTWQSVSEDSSLGETSSIRFAISPNYKADKTVFAGTDRGLFVTTEAGKTWDKLSSSANIENGYIEGVAISPNYQSDQTFIVSVRGEGLFKTVNRGQAFTPIGNNDLAFARINNVPCAGKPIQFSPAYATDNTLYGFGSAKSEIFKSTDGGNTWEIMELPEHEDQEPGLLRSINLVLYVYRGQTLRLLLSLIAALLAYFVLGYLGLEKRLPLNKIQIQALGSFIVFLGAVIVFFA